MDEPEEWYRPGEIYETGDPAGARGPDVGVVVATAWWEPWLFGGSCVPVLTGVGWLIQAAGRLLDGTPGVGPVPDLPWPVFGLWAGVLLGVVLGWVVHSERLAVRIAPDRIVFGRNGRGPVFERDRIGAVHLEGAFLVIDGALGERLGREPVDGSRLQTLRETLVRYEYPCSEGPPPPPGPWSL